MLSTCRDEIIHDFSGAAKKSIFCHPDGSLHLSLELLQATALVPHKRSDI
jgi:hypothetical protein